MEAKRELQCQAVFYWGIEAIAVQAIASFGKTINQHFFLLVLRFAICLVMASLPEP